MSSPVEEQEGIAPRTARDLLPRVVVISMVVLIAVGLVLAIVLVVKDRKTSPKPASQSSVSTTDTTPGVQASSTPTPANTAAGALDPAKVAAAVDPWLVQLTIKRPSGATDTGNGIVLTADGQFLANDHLVDGALSIVGTVGSPGNTHTYTATVIGHDSPRDVGLLQLEGASGLPTPALGVSATVMLGEPVIAVGHAPSPGATPAMTEMIPGLVIGIDQRVPATDPDSELKSLPGVIQIYASMQAEDNGGPVVNSDGQIIGVLVAEATSLQTQYDVPIAYAIPIKTALDSAQLIREGNGHQ
ncbi:MAG TPA: S1C family serine protease [Actinomycetota bacterium]|nr:S1C family serine protease [Actinomycetota bacterium]